jgi:MYXO-CTERM domain-containing protein
MDEFREGDRRRAASWWLAALFAVAVVPAIAANGGGTSEAADELRYHLPAIRMLVRDGLHTDFVLLPTATTPGYHVVMAFVAEFFSSNLTVLRLCSSTFGLWLVLAVASPIVEGAGSLRAMVLCLPLLLSSYVLGSAIWLTTDDAGWALVAAVLALAIFGRRRRMVGVLEVAAVAVRQSNLWVVVPSACRVCLDSGTWRGRARRMMRFAAPIAVVAGFAILWHGLTPPAFAEVHERGLNPAALCVVLGLLGAFGTCYLPLWDGATHRSAVRDVRTWCLVAAAAILPLLVPSAFDSAAGRWGGGLWIAVHAAPSIAGRSLLLPLPAGVAGYVIAVGCRGALAAGRSRQAVVLLTALGTWALAQMANAQSFQRYYEPMVLIGLAWLATLSAPRLRARPPTAWIGVATLTAVQGAIAISTIYAGLFVAGR